MTLGEPRDMEPANDDSTHSVELAIPRDVWMQIPARIRASDVFFFNDTATTEIYTLSLHDALRPLPVWIRGNGPRLRLRA